MITNSWIIKVEPYTVHLAHQNHVALQLVECDEHTFTPDRQVAQFLSVRVEHVQTHQFLFMIRLNARDYADVQDRLQSPIANVRGVVVNPVGYQFKLCREALILCNSLIRTFMPGSPKCSSRKSSRTRLIEPTRHDSLLKIPAART